MIKPLPIPARRALRRILPEDFYLRYFGRHERMSGRIWRQLAAQLTGGILDIGACYGEYALAAREVNPLARVVAFEPMPSNAERLKAAVHGRNIEIVDAAVTDADGPLSFCCAGTRSYIGAGGISVPGITLDTWLGGAPVSLMKIDVETAAGAVLRGARQTIARHEPDIICEVLTDEIGREVMAALPPSYTYFRINENRGLRRRAVVNREHWAHKNWFFTVRPLPPSL